MCICTRLTSAREVAAPPKSSTNPSNAPVICFLISTSPESEVGSHSARSRVTLAATARRMNTVTERLPPVGQAHYGPELLD